MNGFNYFQLEQWINNFEQDPEKNTRLITDFLRIGSWIENNNNSIGIMFGKHLFEIFQNLQLKSDKVNEDWKWFLQWYATILFSRKKYLDSLQVINTLYDIVSTRLTNQNDANIKTKIDQFRIEFEKIFFSSMMDFSTLYNKEKVGKMMLVLNNTISEPDQSRTMLETTQDDETEMVGTFPNVKSLQSAAAHIKQKVYQQQVEMNSKELLQQLFAKPKQGITIVMTTCKRLATFKETMNSFLENCLDVEMATQWLVIDDNSSESDRKEMKSLFPFIQLVCKTPKDKGHAASLNIALELIRSEYVFFLEDDWKMMARKKLFAECIEVLEKSSQFGQCLANFIYAESYQDVTTAGGLLHQIQESGKTFLSHVYFSDRTSKEFKEYTEKINGLPNHAHWPHFSLNPGLMRYSALEKIGKFSLAQNFEFEYGLRYAKQGYYTAFLNDILFFNIGKKRHGKGSTLNAYQLNETLP